MISLKKPFSRITLDALDGLWKKELKLTCETENSPHYKNWVHLPAFTKKAQIK